MIKHNFDTTLPQYFIKPESFFEKCYSVTISYNLKYVNNYDYYYN